MKLNNITNKVVFYPRKNIYKCEEGVIQDLNRYKILNSSSDMVKSRIIENFKTDLSNKLVLEQLFVAKVEDERKLKRTPIFNVTDLVKNGDALYLHDHLDWEPNVFTAIFKIDSGFATEKSLGFKVVLNFMSESQKMSDMFILDSAGIYGHSDTMNSTFGYLENSIYRKGSYFSEVETGNYWMLSGLKRLVADIILSHADHQEKFDELFSPALALRYKKLIEGGELI